MGWTIFLIIMFILCILFLLPIRVKAAFGGGKWSVKIYYVFIRVFRKESAPPPPPPETPPKPEDITIFEPGTDPDAPDVPPPAPAMQTAPPDSVTEPVPDAESEPETIQENPEAHKRKKRKKRKSKKEDAESAEDEKNEAEQPAADADAQAEEDDPKKKKKKPGFFKRIKPHSLSDVIGLIKDGFAALTPALRFLFRHFHFRHVRIRADIASDDPANTATLYGKICAAAFNLLAQLQCLFDFQTDEFRVLADFYGEKSDYSGSLELRVSPAVLILTVLLLGIKFLWRTFRRFRREDKEEKRREKESAPLPQKA